MQGLDDTAFTLDDGGMTEIVGMLAGVVVDVVAEPENLEGALRRMVDGLRGLLGLRAISFSASFGQGRGVSATSGIAGGAAFEPPIRRGKTRVGALLVYLDAPGDRRKEVLRAAAGVAALALDVAHAREVAAQKKAQGSVVQIASEALGVIKEEKDLYRTVLVLTLELLDASGGVILLGDGGVVSLGFEGLEDTLVALR